MKPLPSTVLVFGTSAAVLVLEILAGRLMAPYVGISLETFTAIIGTVLAGIAIGSATGGWAADRHDARRLIGPALVAGGALSWLSLAVVRFMGPEIGTGAMAIVALSIAAFLLPAAVLSAVGPLVAKLRLESLEDTGAVVGGLSAAGTAGALAGTFVTGFVLVSAAPTHTIVLGIGALLVFGGVIIGWRLAGEKPNAMMAILVVAAGFGGGATDSPCEQETAYFCVKIVPEEGAPAERSLYLDRLRHAFVDLDDPAHLDVRYIRLFAAVAATFPEGPERVLHIGGGGFSFPRYLRHVDDETTNLVLEIDEDLVQINKDRLGLVVDDRLEVRVGDGRLALAGLRDDQFDLVVGDAFGSSSVPWHLTTAEFIAEVDRVMTPDGIYLMNVLDGDRSRFARAELATLAERFAYLELILPAGGVPPRQVNHVLVASHRPIPPIVFASVDGELWPDDVARFIDGQGPLRDDFAPVDQLLP